MKQYSYNQSNDNSFYYFDAQLHITGSYLLTAAVFRLGLLTVTLYENDDFTNFKYSFKVPRLDLDFDEDLHVFFKNRDQQYSLVIHGMIRIDYSNMYNFTVSSNKDTQVYIDQKLMLDKP